MSERGPEMATLNVPVSETTKHQIKEYRLATSLLLTAAHFRSSRMTPEERDALCTAARVIGELADSDEGRPGVAR